MENNLNELNNVLFETLRGVQDDSIDAKKAQTITNVANSIIHNSKTQLQAFRLTNGMAYQDALKSNADKTAKISIASAPAPKPGSYGKKEADTFELKYDFAKEKGYKNVADAISAMGKYEFERDFKIWMQS